MKITRKTRTATVVHTCTHEQVEEIIAAVPAVPMAKPLLGMTVGEFIEATQDGFIASFLREKRAVQAFGRIKQYRAEMADLNAFLKTLEVPRTPEEVKAAHGVPVVTPAERLLLDTRRLFGLHSLEDAQRVPMAELLLLMKDEAAGQMYTRNYAAIMRQKGGKV